MSYPFPVIIEKNSWVIECLTIIIDDFVVVGMLQNVIKQLTVEIRKDPFKIVNKKWKRARKNLKTKAEVNFLTIKGNDDKQILNELMSIWV